MLINMPWVFGGGGADGTMLVMCPNTTSTPFQYYSMATDAVASSGINGLHSIGTAAGQPASNSQSAIFPNGYGNTLTTAFNFAAKTAVNGPAMPVSAASAVAICGNKTHGYSSTNNSGVGAIFTYSTLTIAGSSAYSIGAMYGTASGNQSQGLYFPGSTSSAVCGVLNFASLSVTSSSTIYGVSEWQSSAGNANYGLFTPGFDQTNGIFVNNLYLFNWASSAVTVQANLAANCDYNGAAGNSVVAIFAGGASTAKINYATMARVTGGSWTNLNSGIASNGISGVTS